MKLKSDGVLYDNTNGLPTSEANAIVQTADGFIWIVSYGGLIRFDGNTFVRMDSTSGITSIKCLYVDSMDRLWIGTNDNGIAVMEQDEIRRKMKMKQSGKKNGNMGILDANIEEARARMYALYGENHRITGGQYDKSLAVKCVNGTFVGKKTDGKVVAFKGIPFVGKQPVGDLRWKAPVDIVPDDGVYEAYYFAKAPVRKGTSASSAPSTRRARAACI